MIDNARECGERDDTPEQDRDRQRRSEAMFLGKVVERLLAIGHLQTARNRAFVIEMDRKLNVFREVPSSADIAAIKQMAWDKRHILPRFIAPKLPPGDPIVKEMGLG